MKKVLLFGLIFMLGLNVQAIDLRENPNCQPIHMDQYLAVNAYKAAGEIFPKDMKFNFHGVRDMIPPTMLERRDGISPKEPNCAFKTYHHCTIKLCDMQKPERSRFVTMKPETVWTLKDDYSKKDGLVSLSFSNDKKQTLTYSCPYDETSGSTIEDEMTNFFLTEVCVHKNTNLNHEAEEAQDRNRSSGGAVTQKTKKSENRKPANKK